MWPALRAVEQLKFRSGARRIQTKVHLAKDEEPIEFRHNPETTVATFENLDFDGIEEAESVTRWGTMALGWYGKVKARKGDASFTFEFSVNVLSRETTTTSQNIHFPVRFNSLTRYRYGDVMKMDSLTQRDIIQFFKDNLKFTDESQKAELDKLFTVL